ncbi:hypothetical protein GCM10020227_64180 [Streptomyces flavovirens]
MSDTIELFTASWISVGTCTATSRLAPDITSAVPNIHRCARTSGHARSNQERLGSGSIAALGGGYVLLT